MVCKPNVRLLALSRAEAETASYVICLAVTYFFLNSSITCRVAGLIIVEVTRAMDFPAIFVAASLVVTSASKTPQFEGLPPTMGALKREPSS